MVRDVFFPLPPLPPLAAVKSVNCCHTVNRIPLPMVKLQVPRHSVGSKPTASSPCQNEERKDEKQWKLWSPQNVHETPAIQRTLPSWHSPMPPETFSIRTGRTVQRLVPVLVRSRRLRFPLQGLEAPRSPRYFFPVQSTKQPNQSKWVSQSESKCWVVKLHFDAFCLIACCAWPLGLLQSCFPAKFPSTSFAALIHAIWEPTTQVSQDVTRTANSGSLPLKNDDALWPCNMQHRWHQVLMQIYVSDGSDCKIKLEIIRKLSRTTMNYGPFENVTFCLGPGKSQLPHITRPAQSGHKTMPNEAQWVTMLKDAKVSLASRNMAHHGTCLK